MTDHSALSTLGLPDWVAARAVVALGPAAASTIDGDPWSVLGIPGVRPEQADAYARRRLGSAATPSDPRRLAALATWLVRRATRDGHTVLPRPVVAAALATYGITDADQAITAAAAAGSITSVPPDYLALRPIADAERTIAAHIGHALTAGHASTKSAGDGDDADTLAHGVTIIAGHPGDRLDAAIRTAVSAARNRGTSVTPIAPTAWAARRLGDLVGEPAHVDPPTAADDIQPAGLVLIGEAHAMSAERIAEILRATAGRTSLVLAGDVRGMASVHGPGNVLGDLFASGRIRCIDTEDAHPDGDVAATIAELTASIGRGVLPTVDATGKEVAIAPAASAAEARHRAVRLAVESIPRTLGIDSQDVVVLAPNVRGQAGTQALNADLKSAVNKGDGGTGIDVGDRVVVTADLGSDVRVGDVGTVLAVTPDALLVSIAGRDIQVPAPGTAVLQHGWALTVARAMTGRWPACVLVLTAESAGLLSRALLRTAVGRAEHHLSIVHAAGPVVARTVRHGRERRRRTALPSLLQDHHRG